MTRVPTPMTLEVAAEPWPLKQPFRITGYTFETLDLLVCTLRCEGKVGRGEATGVYYLRETGESMHAQIEAVRSDIEAGISREALQALLPPGGARNALDCALWALESRRAGRPAWQLAGLQPPRPLLTTFTLGAEAPTVMAQRAREAALARALKLKLIGDGEDAERVRAVRQARRDCWLAVDANQAFDRAGIEALLPTLVEADVRLLEQPCKIGDEATLRGLDCPMPLAADESVQTREDIERMTGLFDVINIKLDKSGGLTEALAMAHQARARGLGVMVGNMIGTSLSCAPAFLVGQLCEVVDLDGPWHLARDRTPAVRYEDGLLDCPPGGWDAEALA